MKPLVSIVVPIYNCEKYLVNCLNSIVSQTYKNLEIILIDDGSSDTSGNICDSFADNDKRIKVVHNTNHGVSYSRNIGIKLSTGDKILFIDSDDSVNRDYVMRLVEQVENVDIDLVVCNVNDIYTGKNKVKSRVLPKNLTGIFLNDFYSLVKVPLLAGPVCKLYDGIILKEKKVYFNEAIHFGEDFLFNLSYLKYVNSYKLIDVPMYNYYHRPGHSLMKNRTTKNFDGAIKIVSEFRKFLVEHNIINADVALTYMCLSYIRIRYFANVSDGDNSYLGYKKRVDAFRNVLDGMYSSPSPRKFLQVFLLKYNFTKILYAYFKCKK